DPVIVVSALCQDPLGVCQKTKSKEKNNEKGLSLRKSHRGSVYPSCEIEKIPKEKQMERSTRSTSQRHKRHKISCASCVLPCASCAPFPKCSGRGKITHFNAARISARSSRRWRS